MTENINKATLTENSFSTPTKRSGKGRFIVLLIGSLILMGLFGVFAWSLQTRESVQLSGFTAPDFELTTFDGDRITLSELKGQVVVINFWASW